MTAPATRPTIEMPSRLVLIVGPFGSGKTTVAANLARVWARDGCLSLVDFDHITPYFRSRELSKVLESAGVQVLGSGGPSADFETPAIPPEVCSAILDTRGRVLFDVGGDDQGARTLAQFSSALREQRATTWFVLNSRRPDTRTAPEVEAALATVEAASGLEVDRLVANTNLGPETTIETVAEGVAVADEVAAARGEPHPLIACPARLEESVRGRWPERVAVPLRQYLSLPWAQESPTQD